MYNTKSLLETVFYSKLEKLEAERALDPAASERVFSKVDVKTLLEKSIEEILIAHHADNVDKLKARYENPDNYLDDGTNPLTA